MFTNQHYIPQFLLRGFHTGNEAQIWAFDKMTGRSFTTAIDKVASEYGFYNIGGSAQLDDVIWKFEAATAPIVEEIRARKSLAGIDDHKRIWLSGFTALQYVRTRAFRRTFTRHDAADHSCRYTNERREALKENQKTIGTRLSGF
jgi:hypothetical protein